MARVIDPRRHRNERIAASILILLVAAAAAVAIWWNGREQKELRSDRTYIPGPAVITPDVIALQELVRIDSSTPEGVAAAARWIAAYLQRNGIRAELIESAPSRLNVYARIEGREPGDALLLFNHLDVVPPGDGWTVEPFAAKVFGEKLYGRGTVDMKALTICQLVAFVAVAKSGRAPRHDLVFLATAEEEHGSREGMQWLLAHRSDLFHDVAYGLTEGGITELVGQKLTYFGVEVGGKQLVHAVVSASTRDALRGARTSLEPFMFPRRADRVVPAVRAYFEQVAPTRLQFRDALQDIDRTIREGRFWQLPPTYRDLVQNSLSTSAPRERDGRWEMDVFLINLPDEQPEARLAWLAKTIAPSGAFIRDVLVKEGPVVPSPHQTPLFALLTAEAEERYGVPAGVEVLYRSSTDSRFLRRRGIVCYGISPYMVDYYQSRAIHGSDESITVGAFTSGVAYLRAVVEAWSDGLQAAERRLPSGDK
ncbi:MAG TPA: M20/M25/M40 family metallo-hydrolase [Thermoanaerobaculia bacterium]|nr:M20/M25/M40 family metallo-hydrolase [Thermoanaerobaculia bacterium]